MLQQDYQPPEVWRWNQQNGGKWTAINRPIAGATHDAELPQGKHPLQLYSLATPNGQKVTIMDTSNNFTEPCEFNASVPAIKKRGSK